MVHISNSGLPGCSSSGTNFIEMELINGCELVAVIVLGNSFTVGLGIRAGGSVAIVTEVMGTGAGGSLALATEVMGTGAGGSLAAGVGRGANARV